MSSCWVYSTLHWPVSLWAKKTRLESPLHMISLHKHCLKNATSEAIASLHKYHLKKHDLGSSLRMASLHPIDQAHWVYKRDFGSSLHMVSLYKHCLKNATSEAIASLHKYRLKKHNLRSSLRMASLHSIDQAHWVYKHDFGSLLHIVSLHKYCLKNATLEAIASLHKYRLKKHNLGSLLRMASLHNIASKNATSEAHYTWPVSINIAPKTRLRKLIMHSQPSSHILNLLKSNKLCANKHQ